MNILLLGGTSDAIQLAKQLIALDINVIYSIAGLVRQPTLNCQIHRGGFQGKMAEFLRDQQIDLLIDATHPYASKISQQAKQAANDTNIDYWLYYRPAWQKTDKDQWIEFNNWDDLLPILQNYKFPFFTLGQAPLRHLDDINLHQHWTVRTAIKHTIHHPQLRLITAIGGFSLDEEAALFKKYAFDVLICKNSGGNTVIHKLQLARQYSIPVLMQCRPPIVKTCSMFTVLSEIIDKVQKHSSF